jgi:hypothetical protein
MKKLFTIFALLALVMCFALPAIAGDKTIVGGVLQIRKADSPPVIDGELDDIWCMVTAIPLTKFEGVCHDSVMSFDDHSATFRVMWDDNAFYILVTVVDDSAYGLEVASPWLNDNVEVFFDGGNEKAASYDGNDIQWRWVRDETVENHPATGTSPGNWAWGEHDGSYVFELEIPADQLVKNSAQLFDLAADTEIGFEISSADRESAAGTRQDVLHWWACDALTWNNPSLFGTAVLTSQTVSTTMNIHYAETAPVIDGVMTEGEWDAADEMPLEKFEDAPDIYPPDSTLLTWLDHSASYWTMYDADYFYVCVKTEDDSLYGSEVASPWLNDNIEMFFDGGNEKAASYDGNDIQWRWVWGETVESHPATGTSPGEWVWGDNPDYPGYVFEMRIAQAELVKNSVTMFDLVGDTEIGFEISNADRESAAGTRQDVRHWWTNNGLTWNNPQLFGTAVLGAAAINKPGDVVATDYKLAQNYPNPFNPTTTISYALPKTEKVKLVVYNLLGDQVAQLVNSTKNAGTHTVTFNAQNLSSGVYFYRLDAGSVSLVKKMMFIK